jgi:hypothetical protein
MDNFAGTHTMHDGRQVVVSGVGVNKFTHTFNDDKIKITPHLAELLQKAKLRGKGDMTKVHRKFAEFIYYEVIFEISGQEYIGTINVGVDINERSVFYDINPFEIIKK